MSLIFSARAVCHGDTVAGSDSRIGGIAINWPSPPVASNTAMRAHGQHSPVSRDQVNSRDTSVLDQQPSGELKFENGNVLQR